LAGGSTTTVLVDATEDVTKMAAAGVLVPVPVAEVVSTNGLVVVGDTVTDEMLFEDVEVTGMGAEEVFAGGKVLVLLAFELVVVTLAAGVGTAELLMVPAVEITVEGATVDAGATFADVTLELVPLILDAVTVEAGVAIVELLIVPGATDEVAAVEGAIVGAGATLAVAALEVAAFVLDEITVEAAVGIAVEVAIAGDVVVDFTTVALATAALVVVLAGSGAANPKENIQASTLHIPVGYTARKGSASR
jgi:hypothetical protein